MRNQFTVEAQLDEKTMTLIPPPQFGGRILVSYKQAWMAAWICYGSRNEEGLGILLRIARRFIRLHYWLVEYKQSIRNKKGIKAI